MTDEQKRLVQNNIGLVKGALKGIRYGGDKNEFMSIGYEALCEAATRYRPENGKFSSFAYLCIHNAYIDEMRNRAVDRKRVVNIDEQIGDVEDGWTYIDIISERMEREEDKYIDRMTAKELSYIAAHVLNEGECEFLNLLMEAKSQSEMARMLGVSKQRVSAKAEKIRNKVIYYWERGIKD